MANPINSVAYNTEAELFGSNELPRNKAVVKRYNSNIVTTTATTATPGRVQKQIGATKKDFIPDVREKTYGVEPEPIERDIYSGTHTTTRAARVVHQYDINFWGTTGVLGYATRSTQPQISEAEVDSKYNDFIAFSYVPDALLPSKEVFRDMIDPQARTAAMPAFLLAAGVDTAGTQGLVSQTDLGSVEGTPTAPPPFASNLQSSCGTDSYFARSTGPVYTSERPLA